MTEIKKMQKKLALLEEENLIIKKTMAIFKKIMGFKYSKKIDKSLVISALQNACYNQDYPKNVILHSDRGSRYASNDYIKITIQLGMNLSYSKKGRPSYNAPMESFHSSLKKSKFICNTTMNLIKQIENFSIT